MLEADGDSRGVRVAVVEWPSGVDEADADLSVVG